MTIKVDVSDPVFVYDLLYSLKSADYRADVMDETTLEVEVPSVGTAEQARLHLGLYLANWRARHPGIVADIREGG